MKFITKFLAPVNPLTRVEVRQKFVISFHTIY